MRISKIERQKRKAALYDLYSEDVFLFEITEDTLVHFALSANGEYSDRKLKDIQEYDRFMRCVHQALRYLARRPHLQAELRLKLRQKQYEAAVIERTIHYLLGKKYLSDEDFIKRFIADEKQLKKSGPLRIRAKLFEKGAKRELIDELLERYYPEEEIARNARALAGQKRQRLAHLPADEIKKKLTAVLKNKGYNWDVIARAIRSEK